METDLKEDNALFHQIDNIDSYINMMEIYVFIDYLMEIKKNVHGQLLVIMIKQNHLFSN